MTIHLEIEQPFVPTQPPIEPAPQIFGKGTYIIRNMGQQQVLFNPCGSLKSLELVLHIDISEIKPNCSTF